MKNTRRLFLLVICLCLSVLAPAQADVTLQVKTDMDCYWRLDGQPMGILLADDSRGVPVSPGEHLIQANSTDGVATMRTKAQVDQGQTTVEIQLEGGHIQQAKTANKPADADATLTWTDPATGLMWTKKDNGSDVNWNQAKDYCSSLQLAGHGDWRLPTIEELQGIYDPSASTQAVSDSVAHNVQVKGNLKITALWNWSSSYGDAPAKGWPIAWVVGFGLIEEPRRFFPIHFNYKTRALCVRDSGE